MSELERMRAIAVDVLADALGVMGPIVADEVLLRLRDRANEPLMVLGESFLRLVRDELPPEVPFAAIEARIRARLRHR